MARIRGHSLVVRAVHIESIFVLPSERYQGSFELLRTLKDYLEETLSPAGFNVVVNSGKVNGQTVDHAHILVPRVVPSKPYVSWQELFPRGVSACWLLPRPILLQLHRLAPNEAILQF